MEEKEEGNGKVMLMFAVFALIKTCGNTARVECIPFISLTKKKC